MSAFLRCSISQVYCKLFCPIGKSVNHTVPGLKMMKVEYGTAQGSCLGPLIFISFCNDIYKNIQESNILLFADDKTLNYSNSNIDCLYWIISHELNLFFDWFKPNKLSLNLGKNHMHGLFVPHDWPQTVSIGEIKVSKCV